MSVPVLIASIAVGVSLAPVVLWVGTGLILCLYAAARWIVGVIRG